MPAAKPRAIYDVKRAIPGYVGPLLRVRHCELNMVADWSPEMADFLGKSAAAVEVWYDQSGNARHAEQPDPALQPFLRVLPNGTPVVDFRVNRFLRLPPGTVPYGGAPFSILFKHGDIDNPIGGVIGSGVYGVKHLANAVRRDYSRYVNYFWDDDIKTPEGTYAAGNVVAFTYSAHNTRAAVVNGEVVTRNAAQTSRFSHPEDNTLGKSYGNNEYLNGDLEFVHITEEIAPLSVLFMTGEWVGGGF